MLKILKIKNIEDKTPDITNLATNATLNANINEVNNKLPSITILAKTTTNLATNTVLTALENKTPNNSKYITTPDFNRLTAENFTARLAQVNLASKIDVATLV